MISMNRTHLSLMKSGAPPDKFGVLYRMLTYRIPWFHKQNSIVGPWSYLKFFLEVWEKSKEIST